MFRHRSSHCIAFIAVYLGLTSQAQELKPAPKADPNLGALTGSNLYRNKTLAMAITLPADFQQRDPSLFWGQIRRHISDLKQTDDNSARRSDIMTKCFQPLLFAAASKTSAAAFGMVFLAEVNRSCFPRGLGESDMLDNMALTMGQIAGMPIVGQPTSYLLDNYKVHFLAAQGTPPIESKTQSAVASASVDISDHLLLWMFMASDNVQLNRILASPVQFGDHLPQPFSPFSMQPVATP